MLRIKRAAAAVPAYARTPTAFLHVQPPCMPLSSDIRRKQTPVALPGLDAMLMWHPCYVSTRSTLISSACAAGPTCAAALGCFEVVACFGAPCALLWAVERRARRHFAACCKAVD